MSNQLIRISNNQKQKIAELEAEVAKQTEIARAHAAANKRLVAEKNEEIRILREIDKFQTEDITRLESELSLCKSYIESIHHEKMFRIWKDVKGS
jgi:hypothetical protein